MDPVLIVTLIILHQVSSFLCKPLSERNADFENVAINDMLKDINNKVINLDEVGQHRGGMKVVHMIRLVHKDGTKGPVAIFMVPKPVAIDNKNFNLYEKEIHGVTEAPKPIAIDNKNIKYDNKIHDVSENRRVSTERSRESIESFVNENEEFTDVEDKVVLINNTVEDKDRKESHEISREISTESHLNEIEDFKVTEDKVVSVTEEKQLNKTQDMTTEEESETIADIIEDITEAFETIDNENDDSMSTDIVITTNKNDLQDIVQDQLNNQSDSFEIKSIENEDFESKDLQFKDIDNFENDSELVEVENELESMKDKSDPKVEVIPIPDDKTLENTVPDIVLKEISKTDDLKCKIENTDNPEIFLDGFNIKDIKTKCNNNKKNTIGSRTYHLLFVFNR